MKLQLRLRDLNTGELATGDFESEADALVWLKARPPGIQVLGIGTTGVPDTMAKLLRSTMRPLDAAEQALERAIDAQLQAAAEKRVELERAKAEAAAAERKAAMKDADPNRPMEIHWTYDHGMALTDKDDPRAITDEARAAVLAYVEERQDWVRDRGQMVGDATVTVYPGPLPATAGGERVQRGRFTPVTAAPKSKPS